MVDVVVRHAGGETVLEFEAGTVLRDALLAAGLSPDAGLGERINCGGRGLCASCGVRLVDGPSPEYGHDRLAER